MRRSFITAIALAAILATSVGADDTEQKRAWLRSQFAGKVKSSRTADKINARLNRLSPAQIGLMYQKQKAAANVHNVHPMALQQHGNHRHFNQSPYGYGYPYPNVQYVPQITWLPTGPSLGVNGNSFSPSFSSIPHMDVFNYQTGETRRVNFQQSPPTHKVRTWHDGLRTRVESLNR